MSKRVERTEWHVAERFRNWRLDHFLKEQIPKLSRAQIQLVIRDRIEVSWSNEGTLKPSTRVQVGGKVYANYPALNEEPKIFEVPILYDMQELLAVNKPAGVLVHPTNRARKNTLIEFIRRTQCDPHLTLTHRLDRDTSGVLLMARSVEKARACGKAFMARALSKTYLAWVSGAPEKVEGIVDVSIGKHLTSKVFVRRGVRSDGENAITHFRVLKKCDGRSLLELKPVTGRRHQLRVHCEWLGCPIEGDPLYGLPDEHFLALVGNENPTPMLRLHAWKLEGNVGDLRLSIVAPVPWNESPA